MQAKHTKTHLTCDFWFINLYVLEFQGIEKLIVLVTHVKPDVILFDILYKMHISLGHHARVRVKKELGRRYKKQNTQNEKNVLLKSVSEVC